MIRRATELLDERQVNEPPFFNSRLVLALVRMSPQVCETGTWKVSYC